MADYLQTAIAFLLGIATTILTQFITRRTQYSDAKLHIRLQRLALIREWMEATRVLFDCRYPDDPDIVVAFIANIEENDKYSRYAFDQSSSVIIHEILTEYQQADQKQREEERKGKEALQSLRDINWKFWIKRFIFSKSKDKEIRLRSSIQRKIYPEIQLITSSMLQIYDIFPTNFNNSVFLQRLKHTKPEDIKNIFYSISFGKEKSLTDILGDYILERSKLGTEKVRIKKFRADAMVSINRVFEIIQEYEDKWIIPLK